MLLLPVVALLTPGSLMASLTTPTPSLEGEVKDNNGDTVVEEVPPQAFDTVVEEVQWHGARIQTLPNGEYNTQSLLAWADLVPKIYESIFSSTTVINQLKSDLNNSIKTVRHVFAADPTANVGLQTMVRREVAEKTLAVVRKDKTSAVIGLLWMKRAMQFMLEFLKNTVANPDKTTKQCAQETYAAVLKPYHGWLTSKAVGFTMGWTPAKVDLIQKFGYTNDTFQVKMTAFLAVFEPIITTIHTFLDGIGANFPDTV